MTECTSSSSDGSPSPSDSCSSSRATGGTVTTDGDYTIHTFTSSHTFAVVDSTLNEVDVLVVGGGGGGSSESGGGGGGEKLFIAVPKASPHDRMKFLLAMAVIVIRMASQAAFTISLQVVGITIPLATVEEAAVTMETLVAKLGATVAKRVTEQVVAVLEVQATMDIWLVGVTAEPVCT